MEDKDILIHLKKGDDHCLKFLYKHLVMVRSWVYKNNGNDQDALDLFQEAIIVFYKNVMSGNYEMKSKISTYLFEICKRQWLKQLNRRKKFESPDLNILTLQRGKVSMHVEIGNDKPSLKNYLDQGLNKLGEPCKTLLEMSIFLKVKMQEVAEKLNYADAHSARQQKLRCLKRLRNFISYDVVINLE